MSSLRLVVHHGTHARRHEFHRRTILAVGRDEARDVVVSDPSIDECHALFAYDDATERWSIEDCGSATGTSTGGIPLVPHQPRALPSRCRVQLGPISLDVLDPRPLRRVRFNALSAAELHVTLSRRGHEDFFPLRIIGLQGSAVSTPLLARSRPYLIGRTRFCELRVDDQGLSREQVSLRVTADALPRVTNIGNGPIVSMGSRPLQPGETSVWPSTDMMQVGRYVFALWDLVRDVLDELDAEIAHERRVLAGIPNE